MERTQREYYLNEQMKAIQKELTYEGEVVTGRRLSQNQAVQRAMKGRRLKSSRTCRRCSAEASCAQLSDWT
jgi:ATP-dependent Lon protease